MLFISYNFQDLETIDKLFKIRKFDGEKILIPLNILEHLLCRYKNDLVKDKELELFEKIYNNKEIDYEFLFKDCFINKDEEYFDIIYFREDFIHPRNKNEVDKYVEFSLFEDIILTLFILFLKKGVFGKTYYEKLIEIEKIKNKSGKELFDYINDFYGFIFYEVEKILLINESGKIFDKKVFLEWKELF